MKPININVWEVHSKDRVLGNSTSKGVISHRLLRFNYVFLINYVEKLYSYNMESLAKLLSMPNKNASAI